MTRSFVACWIAVAATLGLACGDGDGDGTRPPSEQTPVTPKTDPQPPPSSDPQPPPSSDVPKSDGGTAPNPPAAPGPAPSCDPSLEQSACGGVLAGTYVYKEACASTDVAALLAGVCPGISASNVKAVSKGGTLAFSGQSYSLKASTDVTYDLAIPATCAAIGCQGVQMAASSALASKGAASVKVSCSGAIGCTCAVSYTINLTRSGLLTTSGGVATLAAGEQYWYCVKPTGLLYKGKANTADVGIAYALGR